MTETGSAPAVPLRIAFVCYGGVSLAIYMHGVSKELLKLVQASREFTPLAPEEVATAANPFERSDSASGYFEALRAIATAGARTQVVIDVITGTSAGGINGVCLAHALAHNRSLEALRSLWIDQGDIKKLMSHPPVVTWPPSLEDKELLMGGVRSVLGGDDRHTGAPLDGDHFARMVHEALRGMPSGKGSLVPPDQRLSLVVPTTDAHGYTNPIPDDAGHLAHADLSYRQALRFNYEEQGEDHFTDDDVPALTFAARATSGFPGAFPAVSIPTFIDAISDEQDDHAIAQRITQRLTYGERFGVDAGRAWYVDGGVLDNGPFDHAISLIAETPASGETRRVLAYLEPDPGAAPPAEAAELQPSWLEVVRTALWTIPHHGTYVEALGTLSEMNRHIDDVGAVVESLQTTVAATLATYNLDVGSDYQAVVATGNKLRDEAQKSSPLTFQSYCQLRAESIATEFGRLLADSLGYPFKSIRAALVPQVLAAWVRSQPLWTSGDPTELEKILGPVDIPYRRRRAMLLLQTVNKLYVDSADGSLRHGLDALKQVCWKLLVALRQESRATVKALADRAAGVLDTQALGAGYVTLDPVTYAARHSDGIKALFEVFTTSAGFTGSSEKLWSVFQANTQDWPSDARSMLASRYLGFPLWDLAVFPVIQLTGLPQLSKIGVCRFSPRDASLLQPLGDPQTQAPGHKLRGTKFKHFGGFFDRDWRENDYLWGRLDGVELIMNLLADQAGLADATMLRGQSLLGFDAVLDEESGRLDSVAALVEGLRTQVGELRGAGG